MFLTEQRGAAPAKLLGYNSSVSPDSYRLFAAALNTAPAANWKNPCSRLMSLLRACFMWPFLSFSMVIVL